MPDADAKPAQQTNDAADDAPVRTTPFPGLGARYAGAELDNLREALASNDLFYRRPGGYTQRMLDRAAATIGSRYAVAASSGTAAIHVAIAAAQVEPGAEVITTGITDAGSVAGILMQ